MNTGPGYFGYDLAVSRCIGDLARVAVSIKRSGEISRDKYAGIATALKIDYRVAEGDILSKLETLDWVDLKKDGLRIERIDEKIPPTEDILDTLGKYWEELRPSSVDSLTVEGLHRLSLRPYTKEAFISDLGVSENVFSTGYEYGEQARYFGSFSSFESGKDIIWSPLYWAGKIPIVKKYLERQSEPAFDEIGDLTSKFQEYPGMPRDKMVPSINRSLLDAGIYHGYFPSVGVQNRQFKTYEYVFPASPQFETDPSKDLFERARMIVSCIRHGQHHAEISLIKYPRAILRRIRDGSMASHSYAGVQYLLLKLHGIVDLQPVGSRTRVVWIDTPENNLAADIANQLLIGDEVLARSKEDIDIQKILIQGTFNYSSEQRRIKTADQIAAKSDYDRLMESLRGVRE